MNRDYFTRPIQGGGRDAHYYGNSGPLQPMDQPASRSRLMVAALLFAAVVVLWVVI